MPEHCEAAACTAPRAATSDQREEGAIVFSVEGMRCASCAARVEKAIAAVPGVARASVNFAAGLARVELTEDADTAEAQRAVAQAVERAGYAAAPLPGGDHDGRQRERDDPLARALARRRAQEQEAAAWARRAFGSLALAVPILLLNLPHMLAAAGIDAFAWPAGLERAAPWLSFALATAAQSWAALPFYRGALQRARSGGANMDTLIALGSTAAYGASVVALLRSATMGRAVGGLYFETAAFIVAFICLGRFLEARSKRKAGQAIEALLALAPPTAIVERDGREVEVPIAQVAHGDVVIVKPGAAVPVDGVVVSGASDVDESTLTGESVPVPKAPGERVWAGTMNTTGALRVRAEAVGAETTLARVAQLVEQAQTSKTKIQGLADRASGVFVPTILVIAVVAALGWWLWTGLAQGEVNVAAGVRAAVATLIVACPCALGLATPTAIMVASGAGARRGLLIRQASAIERAAALAVLAMDKTGTITRGELTVVELLPAPGVDEAALLRAAAAAEAQSEHPIAKAVVACAQARGVEVQRPFSFQSRPGAGAIARVEGAEVRVGAASLLREAGVDVEPLAAQAAELEQQGATVVHVARDGKLLGALALRDEPREEAAAVVAELRRRGLRVVMLTGDAEATARAVAQRVGVDEVVARVRPEEKAHVVQQLRSRGAVGMVGDGVNDAAALAQADVGVAIGAGADVAIESADIVLVGSSLWGVLTAIELSRRTMRVIRQNLVWAFGYNLALVPLAALNVVHPALAAAAMGLSSVSVVANSLRLRSGAGPA